MVFLGIDTSNYTTSVAVTDGKKVLVNAKKLLPVGQGERGLRQSDAVFSHLKNMPEVVRAVGKTDGIAAVGVSVSPRDAEGSYMPCFLAGVSHAEMLSSLLGVPLYRFSHQRGHIRAALYSAGCEELIGGEYLAFHVSGGTTEALHVKNGVITLVGKTADISAGQAIDRVGVALGLSFPAGAALEKLALSAEGEKLPEKPRITVRDGVCNLSGLENKAQTFLKKGVSPGVIALYTLTAVRDTLVKMSEQISEKHPGLPILYAGGVMSDKMIRGALSASFDARFAEPEYASDNAAGIALLTADRYFSENHGE
ncbi:MAG: hypothetical protein MJ070_06230 [Lachnospiraceae bacterium]|nr:hypothetical protein [Lachnospiraceae bacterium]